MPKGDFRNLKLLDQQHHTDCCIWSAKYDFLLDFGRPSDFRFGWNRFRVIIFLQLTAIPNNEKKNNNVAGIIGYGRVIQGRFCYVMQLTIIIHVSAYSVDHFNRLINQSINQSANQSVTRNTQWKCGKEQCYLDPTQLQVTTFFY